MDLRFVTDIASFEAGGGVYSFVLSYPDRNLLLRALTLGEMEKWMRALQYQADIVRGGDGTNIVTDTNSFCLSPQGKGRAIKGKYRPPTLEATVEAALNRLQVLESQVSKKEGSGGGTTLRARSMFEVENGGRDYIRPDDVALNDVIGNPKRGGQAPSRGPSAGKLSAFFGHDSHGGGGSGGGGVNDEFDSGVDSGVEKVTVVRKPFKAEGKEVDAVHHHQLAPKQVGGASGGRDRKHSIDDDLQSIEEINALPVPRLGFRKARGSSAAAAAAEKRGSVAETAATNVDDEDGDSGAADLGAPPFSRKPPQLPQSWRHSSSRDLNDDGNKGTPSTSSSGNVGGDQARSGMPGRGKADPPHRNSDFSVMDAYEEDEELRAVEEDLQVRPCLAPIWPLYGPYRASI